ncbi:glycosyltransferase family 2 protein [Candidatus Binatia bacterium]|nr:glycosyltransferase family 2 protein [Candidatus Binatia bacterium]
MSGIVVALPAYNEGSRLEALLDRVRTALADRPYRIVVVDDGSRDNTAAILQRRSRDLPLAVVTHAVNAGLADTLRDGLKWVVDNCGDDDIVVTMDADDTHDPACIGAMTARLTDAVDVVIASRFQPGSQVVGVPWHRRLFSWGVFALLKVLLPIPGVRDYACGYRAMRVRTVRAVLARYGDDLFHLRDWGFICTAELLWKLHTVGARCGEVPFILRYDLKESVSRMRAGRTIAGYGLLVWQSRRPPFRRL